MRKMRKSCVVDILSNENCTSVTGVPHGQKRKENVIGREEDGVIAVCVAFIIYQLEHIYI